jgi:hypothetical protein
VASELLVGRGWYPVGASDVAIVEDVSVERQQERNLAELRELVG